MKKTTHKLKDKYLIESEVNHYITRLGFTGWVSKGVYGKVFSNPDNDSVVCKIGKTEPNLPYLNFVKEVIKQPSNIFLPKIHSFDVFKCKADDSHDSFVIVMEKLELIEDNHVFKYSCKMLEELCNLIFESPKPYKDDFVRLMKHINPFDVTPASISDQLWEALNCVIRAANRCDEFYFTNGVDFHDKNLMYRPSSSSIVIIDPLR